MAVDEDYDEFQFLPWHAEWAGLPWDGDVAVARVDCLVHGNRISGLRWGSDEPELVLLHGSGQNAHTFDTFVLALGRPCLALDLPGHGRSGWRPDGDYLPHTTAEAVAEAVAELAPAARAVVGMSLGGLTGLRLASHRPEAAEALVLVDITPARPELPAAGTGPVSLLSGATRFSSWEEMLDATHATMPQRARETVVPGLRHNARRFADGTWGWRYDRMRFGADPRPLLESLWEDLEALPAPVMLVRGGLSPVVTPAAVEQLLRRSAATRVEVVPDAGHSVQSDQPLALAQLVADFLP